MTSDDTIAYLNTVVRVKVAPSKIHGVGVFALRDMPRGTKLHADMFPKAFKLPFEDFDKLYGEVRQLLQERWPQVVSGEGFMYPDTFLQAFCNHSDAPNYDAKSDLTLRDIQADEEITENYRHIEGYDKIFTWLMDKNGLGD